MDIRIRPYRVNDYKGLKKLLIEANLYYETIDTMEHFERKIDKDADSILVPLTANRSLARCLYWKITGGLRFYSIWLLTDDIVGTGLGID